MTDPVKTLLALGAIFFMCVAIAICIGILVYMVSETFGG